MATTLTEALTDAGPHTVDSLAARMPEYSRDTLTQALEALTAQGVLAREIGDDGVAFYRYVAPERYVQANQDVIRDVGQRGNRRPR
jgi:DNA-binding HxlR family transcriptional regulator